MPKVYLGIDPGQNGSIVCLHGASISWIRLSDPERKVWDWLRQLEGVPCLAVMEQQQPRPTIWTDKQTGRITSTVLRSTCILYGNYRQVRALLTAASIPLEEVLPKAWQQAMHITRRKGEDKQKWKNRLKDKAQQLFPKEKVTLTISDALVLAEYARRLDLGVIATK